MRSILAFLAVLIPLSAAGSGQKPAAPRTAPGAGAVADTTALTEKALRSVVLLIVSAHGEPIGQGSGFVVSRDGKIITNYHVIECADSAILKFPNGAFYAVEGIVASDPAHDLAILKAAGKEFPFLPLGKSQAVRAGQPVLAVGSPLALEGTVSTGIVSGIRDFSDGAYKVIQTTASISPGSSGGALLNMKGEAIGITTFRLVQGENLNFAVPIDYVKGLLASNEVTPLKGQTQGGLCVAAGKPDERKGATQSSVTEPQKAPDLPRKWINVGDGTVWRVRVDGDHLYGVCQLAEGPDLTIHDGGSTYTPVSIGCEYKKATLGQWSGSCRYVGAAEWWPYSKMTCTAEVSARITSVSPSRIEGKSQKGVTKPGGCPELTQEWMDFALIPKD